MKNKVVKIFLYLSIIFVLNLIIYFTNIDNKLIYSFSYFGLSIYFLSNIIFTNRKNNVKIIFSIYILTLLLFNIFNFSYINILFSLMILIVAFYNLVFKYLKKGKEVNNKIKDNTWATKEVIINTKLPDDFNIQEFEIISKNLYTNMEKYFMNFEYDKLKEILGNKLYTQFSEQMKNLQKNNKCAVRNNIEFVDFKINDYKKEGNILVVSISIGVRENKYTKKIEDEYRNNNVNYESYYEIIYIKEDTWIIDSLKLLYSHSLRKKS